MLEPDPDYQTPEQWASYWSNSKPFPPDRFNDEVNKGNGDYQKGIFYIERRLESLMGIKSYSTYTDLSESPKGVVSVPSPFDEQIGKDRLGANIWKVKYIGIRRGRLVFANTLIPWMERISPTFNSYLQYDTSDGLYAGDVIKYNPVWRQRLTARQIYQLGSKLSHLGPVVYCPSFHIEGNRAQLEHQGLDCKYRIFFTIINSTPSIVGGDECYEAKLLGLQILFPGAEHKPYIAVYNSPPLKEVLANTPWLQNEYEKQGIKMPDFTDSKEE